MGFELRAASPPCWANFAPNFAALGVQNHPKPMVLGRFWASVYPGSRLGPGRIPRFLAGIPEDSGRIPGDFPPLAEGTPRVSGEALGKSPDVLRRREEGEPFFQSYIYILPIHRPCGRYVRMTLQDQMVTK